MFFYHVNVGHPVLDEGSRFIAPISDVVFAAHALSYKAQGVGYRVLPAPQEKFREQVWQHELAADSSGWTAAALVNDRIGLGFEVRTRKDQLPCFYQWQNCQAGLYTMGLEPSTHHVLGDQAARERGEMISLRHGESRSYDAIFGVLDGARGDRGGGSAYRVWSRASRRTDFRNRRGSSVRSRQIALGEAGNDVICPPPRGGSRKGETILPER